MNLTDAIRAKLLPVDVDLLALCDAADALAAEVDTWTHEYYAGPAPTVQQRKCQARLPSDGPDSGSWACLMPAPYRTHRTARVVLAEVSRGR